VLTYIGWLLAITFLAVGFGMLKRGKFIFGIVAVIIGIVMVPGTLLLF
jgi:hypothetical protein